MIGQRLGPYEITGRLGEGGMGEVYRARDSKLDRLVALKILPESFASDPDRLMRFDREARTLAALNYPHIAQVYGIEDAAGATSGFRGTRFLDYRGLGQGGQPGHRDGTGRGRDPR